ncbi:hypothetical protein AKAW_10436 [Aspergillus luchuensis IFO 4308]|nr:hypothetical protein AKAW_10436 [Aspergillus luchuensis IFO 4308]
MSLLTHFMVHVSGRMALHPERKLIWQRVIPTLAAEEEYLMHLLLALAGTHALCEAESPEAKSLDPNLDPNFQNNPEANSFRDYHRILDHHQKGLEGFRHALSEATASTAEYIFCGSILIVAFAFASLRIRALRDKGMGFHNGDSAGEPWIDWLHLVRGLGAFDYGMNVEDTPSPDSYGSPNIQTIPELLREQISTIDRLEDMYMRILYVFRFTASERDSSISMDIQTDLEEAAVLSWPHLISQSFILSIQQGQGAGVFEGFSYVILAHFYVILLLFEDLWYLRGAFPREIRNTHMLVVKLGDEALMPLMQWPMAMQEV